MSFSWHFLLNLGLDWPNKFSSQFFSITCSPSFENQVFYYTLLYYDLTDLINSVLNFFHYMLSFFREPGALLYTAILDFSCKIKRSYTARVGFFLNCWYRLYCSYICCIPDDISFLGKWSCADAIFLFIGWSKYHVLV